MEIGWIGTGIMGAPMARRLLRAGHRVAVYNRSLHKARPLEADGARLAQSPADAARGAASIFTMLPDSRDVERVVGELEPGLEAGQLFIDMSTIAPAAARAIAHQLAARGVEFIDAPVSGGEPGAIEGTLTIMVGGSEAALNRARPLLELLGKRITHMGPSGAAQMTKLVNQVAIALTLEAAAEALTLARRAGLEPLKVLQAIGAGGAASWQLNNLGPCIVARDWRPGFLIRLMRKDLRLLAEATAEHQTALPGLSLVTALFDSAAALGHDDDGTQALAACLEAMNGENCQPVKERHP